MNTLISFVVGFSIEKNSKDFGDDVTFWLDARTIVLVLVVSVVFACIVGGLLSFILAKVDSIRVTAVSEIMFIIFGVYLLSSVAFLEGKYDYVSEEVSVLVFGIFSSHFTRYNLTLGSAGKLR